MQFHRIAVYHAPTGLQVTWYVEREAENVFSCRDDGQWKLTCKQSKWIVSLFGCRGSGGVSSGASKVTRGCVKRVWLGLVDIVNPPFLPGGCDESKVSRDRTGSSSSCPFRSFILGQDVSRLVEVYIHPLPSRGSDMTRDCFVFFCAEEIGCNGYFSVKYQVVFEMDV